MSDAEVPELEMDVDFFSGQPYPIWEDARAKCPVHKASSAWRAGMPPRPCRAAHHRGKIRVRSNFFAKVRVAQAPSVPRCNPSRTGRLTVCLLAAATARGARSGGL